ncbi:hypothetical protein EC07798_1920 [Escherichia coli 07798]|nr:hypothetical protein EC07798_1920 [Escherichia coli 07798]
MQDVQRRTARQYVSITKTCSGRFFYVLMTVDVTIAEDVKPLL